MDVMTNRLLVLLRSKRDEIQSLFVQCTKLDVGMNSLLVRAKCPGLDIHIS